MDDLASFVKNCDSVDRNTFKDEGKNRQALAAARAMCARLETPMETVMRMTWMEPATVTAVRVAMDRGLFSKLSEASDGSMTVADLAEGSEMEQILLARLFRHLGAVKVVKEIGPDVYMRTELSDALTKPEVSGAFDFLFDVMLPVYTKLPEFLEKTGYRNPSTIPGPFQYASNQELPFYPWYNEHPKKMQGFSNHMKGYTSGRPGWLDIYAAEELFKTEQPLSDNDVLIVDVAGGYGQDMERLLAKFPEAPGRLILQDQPGVLERATKNKRIELMEYDYYNPQPVEGARCYFLHSILHGGGDERAHILLNNLKGAMKKGYSKLLINENVMPATGCDPLATSLDLIMMGSQSALERDEAHWKQILEACGFKVIKVHTSLAVESIIEAELA